MTVERLKTREVWIGDKPLGGDHPIRIQSMTNTDTYDVKKTVDQVKLLIDRGCDYVRVTVINPKQVDAFEKIKNQLYQDGYKIPLIADVHFIPGVALKAAPIADKVRVNPGNYCDRKITSENYSEEEYQGALIKIEERFLPLLEVCKEHKTALRIGANQGSLSDRILYRYGDTIEGMVASAIEFIEICEKYQFYDLVISMKSSDPLTMIRANRLVVEQMKERGTVYPLHLGVTEAGLGLMGCMKSAMGIGCLIREGIGDTIRVSLTEDPENEVIPAQEIVKQGIKLRTGSFKRGSDGVASREKKWQKLGRNIQEPILLNQVGVKEGSEYSADGQIDGEKWQQIKWKEPIRVHQPKIKWGQESEWLESNREEYSFWKIPKRESGENGIQESMQQWYIRGTIDLIPYLLGGQVDGFILSDEQELEWACNFLQSSRLRLTKTEYISCPGCGRTLFDLQETTQKVEEKTSHLQGVKIAVMGCIVNGPGEMNGADYGYVGTLPGKIALYRGSEVVHKCVDQEDAVDELIALIKADGMWQEPKEVKG